MGFRAVIGQVAFVECTVPCGAGRVSTHADTRTVSGIVVRTEPLTLDLACDEVEDAGAVRVTVCGGGERWEVEGRASVLAEGRVAIEPLVAPHGRDRRRWPRRNVRLGLTLHVWNRAAGELHPHPARSVDISCGGLCVVTPAPMARGSEPMVIVPLPGGTQVMARAEVLDGAEDGNGWRYRLAFRDLRPIDVDRLAAFVASSE